jgi:carbamoyl-phosphate synthase large subunit
VAVKEAVLPFKRFPGVDTTLGPEMKSTGEVMGIGRSFPVAFEKATLAAGDRLPRTGTVFISVTDADKDAAVGVAATLSRLGYRILATSGTADAFALQGIRANRVLKYTDAQQLRRDLAEEASGVAIDAEGEPLPLPEDATRAAALASIVDLIEAGEVDLVINTPRGRGARADGYEIRRAALRQNVPAITTISAAQAAAQAMEAGRDGQVTVASLQDLHPELAGQVYGSENKSHA